MSRGEEYIVRRILTAIDNDAEISQRALSNEIGVAVGTVNWHIRRCVKRGLVKLKDAPVKRYLYYLTPQGFDEKARLTADFVRSSFLLFREGKRQCLAFFEGCDARGVKAVGLGGDGEMAEIAIMASRECGPVKLRVIEGRSDRDTCDGVPVVESLEAFAACSGGSYPEAILLTDLSNPRKAYETLREELRAHGLPESCIQVPKILSFKPDRET